MDISLLNFSSFDLLELKKHILIFSLGLPRLVTTFLVLPVLSKSVLPGMARNTVLISLSLILFPLHIFSFPEAGLNNFQLIIIILKEVFIGFCFGYLVAIFFWALESVGFFIDNQRGATMASSINPLTGSQTSPLAIFLSTSFTALFFVSGGFLFFLGILYKSYIQWPVFSTYPDLSIYNTGLYIYALSHLMALTILLSSPIIIAMFLSEFALALISRFAPQLNVFFLAMPIKSAISNALLFLYIGTLLTFFSNEIRGIASLLIKIAVTWV